MIDRQSEPGASRPGDDLWSPLATEILRALPQGEFRAFSSAEAALTELAPQAAVAGVYVIETWKYAWVAASTNIAEALAAHVRTWAVGACFYKATAADPQTEVCRISDLLTGHGIVDVARRW